MNEYPSVDEIIKIMLDTKSKTNEVFITLLEYNSPAAFADHFFKGYKKQDFDMFVKECPKFIELHKLYRDAVDGNVRNYDAKKFATIVSWLYWAIYMGKDPTQVLVALVDKGAIKDPELEHRLLQNLSRTQQVTARLVNSQCAEPWDFECAAKFAKTTEEKLNLARGAENAAKILIKKEEARETPDILKLQRLYEEAWEALEVILDYGSINSDPKLQELYNVMKDVFNWEKAKNEMTGERIAEYEQTQAERILQLEKERDMYKQISELQSKLLENLNNRASGGLYNIRPDIRRMIEEYERVGEK